ARTLRRPAVTAVAVDLEPLSARAAPLGKPVEHGAAPVLVVAMPKKAEPGCATAAIPTAALTLPPLRTNATTPGGTAAPLYLGYVGSPAAVLDSPFFGTLIAPNAQVTLQTANGVAHTGDFYALELVVAAHANVASNPFTCKL